MHAFPFQQNVYVHVMVLMYACLFVGNGLNIESHFGRISIKNTAIYNNKGNGIKTKLLDGKYYITDTDDTFCEYQFPEGQFPLLLTAIPFAGLNAYTSCYRVSCYMVM